MDEEKKAEVQNSGAGVLRRAMFRSCGEGRECEAFQRLLAYEYSEEDLEHCEDR